MYTYCKGVQVHYFGDEGIVDNGTKSFFLNRLQLFIFENCCDNKNQLVDICLSRYNSGMQHEQLQRAVIRCLEQLIENGLIERGQEGVRYVKVSGEKGKYYPRKLSVELTDRCNLNCQFCYNESSSANKRFVNKNDLFRLIGKIKGKTDTVQLLGGEPLLHKDIEEILNVLTMSFNTYITTNGILINRIPVELLKRLGGLVISMYGYNEESFQAFTGKNNYHKFKASLRYLHEQEIDYAVAITVTQYNIPVLEKYIEELIELRTSKVIFGLPVVFGRAMDNQDAFSFSEECLKRVTHTLKKLIVQYYGKINIEFWNNSKTKLVPLLPEKYNPYCYLCGGGLLDCTITCNQMIKPCGFLPDECCYRSVDELDTIIEGNVWDILKNEKRHIKNYLEKTQIDLNKICNLLL